MSIAKGPSSLPPTGPVTLRLEILPCPQLQSAQSKEEQTSDTMKTRTINRTSRAPRPLRRRQWIAQEPFPPGAQPPVLSGKGKRFDVPAGASPELQTLQSKGEEP